MVKPASIDVVFASAQEEADADASLQESEEFKSASEVLAEVEPAL